MQQLKIVNGQVITPGRIIQGGSVLLKDGTIAGISEHNIDAPDAGVIDAAGKYVSPGFIDLHVHGGGGHDFMDNSIDAFLEIARTHASYGTTAMSPTTLSSSKADLLETLRVYELANKQNISGAQFIGMHLEGPYFAPNQCGAQDPRYIRNPDPEEYKEILASTTAIKRWSAAPELKVAIEFGRYITDKGILAAIAHTDAVYDEALDAFENGYTLATHLYSGMLGVTRRNAYRYAGVVEAAYLIERMDVEIIADGIHLPPPLLKLVYKIKGAKRTALITDAMRAAAMPPGASVLGGLKNGLKVIVEDGVAKLPDRSAFAGSVATFDLLVRNMINLAGVPLTDVIEMATLTPARIMNIADRKGSLEAGKDADVVIFDDNINVEKTIVNGRLIYEK
ncbi:N-acetylglucosamine-6-phosphate deacetylase [Mucilaginibacter sp. L3T2-6]|uniref:N-acetylglucosamine-6-phosphate deacetylase n=1 Tax=Mucilaginibacter sp. L3T2-6 TaxID=3062491 RepID=UPI0026757897|nr:N-acetylglucosamine-6-phosphate deacetylase [Mucilaginibacter sp. L3T2-6]MDO3640875.1 N-acetylglucosamine-6-phosphate deacetylase [Mucilaginibacter sp. L3T2-6]MDV6213649.1 N-acetylglucosamine-6-phosphate deacetylase [Mucilaginibacter sp. L3T2-6]